MQKKTAIIIAAFTILCIAAAALVTKLIMTGINSMGLSGQPGSYQNVKVTMPIGVNKQTLAVVNFRSDDSPSAGFYARGFSRALADRLYSAPTSITQQVTGNEISTALEHQGLGIANPVSDKAAIKAGKELGVYWVVTGDISQPGSNIKISAHLINVQSCKKISYEANGPIDSLPAMQTKLAKDVINGMGLKLSAAQLAEVSKPNFTNIKTFEDYEYSITMVSENSCEKYRWKAVQDDPKSLFAVLRLLEYYAHMRIPLPELQSNKRLWALLENSKKQFPNSSHIAVLRGIILGKTDKYAAAEDELRNVIAGDPLNFRAHESLAYVASLRKNNKLSTEECLKLVKLWPNSPRAHARLSYAYNAAITNTTGHNQAVQKFCKDALNEAVVAIRLNGNCVDGWNQLMSISNRMNRPRDVESAFNEVTKLDKQCINAYVLYASCLSQNGSKWGCWRVYSQADRVFGKNSPDANYIRASAYFNSRDSRDLDSAIRYAKQGMARCKDSSEVMMNIECQSLYRMKRYNEAEQVAFEGLNRWGSLDWKFQLGRCYCLRYEKKGDKTALVDAEKLFTEYTHEVSGDPEGYIQWGWCLSHMGRKSEAKAKFLKALEIDPGNEKAKRKLQYVQ